MTVGDVRVKINKARYIIDRLNGSSIHDFPELEDILEDYINILDSMKVNK